MENRMRRNNLPTSAGIIPLAASLCFTILTGCGDEGDDITNVTNEVTGMERVTAFADLPECSAENFGLIYFVADSAKVFYCDEKKWTTLNGANGADGKDGKDGEGGTDGKDGIDGKDGVSPVLFDSAGKYVPGMGDTISVVIKKYGKMVEGLGECKDTREGEVAHLDSIEGSPYYICKSSSWQTATALEYDTYQWTDTTDGAAKIGAVSQKLYIFDKNRWRAALGAEVELGGCIEARGGEVAKYSGIYFTCKARTWEPSTLLEYDTYGKPCLEDGSIDNGAIHTYNKYVCDNGKFRFAKPMEVAIKRGCTSYNKGESVRYQYSNYVCDPDSSKKFYFKEWRAGGVYYDSIRVEDRDSSGWSYDFDHLNIGSIQDPRDGNVYRTIGIKGQMWMNENMRYEKSNSYCYHDSTKYCKEHGRFYKWNSVDDVCPEGWHLPSWLEYDQINHSVYDCQTIYDDGIGSCTSLIYGMKYSEPYYLNINQGTYEWGRWHVADVGHYLYWTSDAGIDFRDAAFFESTYDYSTGFNYNYYNIRCVKDSEE